MAYNFCLKLIAGDPRPVEGQAQEERAHQGAIFTNCSKKLDHFIIEDIYCLLVEMV